QSSVLAFLSYFLSISFSFLLSLYSLSLGPSLDCVEDIEPPVLWFLFYSSSLVNNHWQKELLRTIISVFISPFSCLTHSLSLSLLLFSPSPLLLQLKDDAVALVDVIAPPDFILNSPIGKADGEVSPD